MTKYQREVLAAKSVLERAGFTSAAGVRNALGRAGCTLQRGARDSRYAPDVLAYEIELKNTEDD